MTRSVHPTVRNETTFPPRSSTIFPFPSLLSYCHSFDFSSRLKHRKEIKSRGEGGLGKNDEANRSWLRVNRSFPPSNEVVFFHQAAKSTNYIFIYSTMRHTARDDSHGHDAGYTWCTHARSRRFIISLREYRLKPELVIIIRVIIYECKEGGNTSLVVHAYQRR